MSERAIYLMAFTAGLVLFCIAFTYIIWMPKIGIDFFVPQTLEHNGARPAYGLFYVVFVLVSSILFLPVIVVHTKKLYHVSPIAMLVAASFFLLALVIGILNNTLTLAHWAYSIPWDEAGEEIAMKMYQISAVEYMALDVAGFSFTYLAGLIYARIFWKTYRLISVAVFISVAFFFIHLPFLFWLQPIGMVFFSLSIASYGFVYILLGRSILVLR